MGSLDGVPKWAAILSMVIHTMVITTMDTITDIILDNMVTRIMVIIMDSMAIRTMASSRLGFHNKVFNSKDSRSKDFNSRDSRSKECVKIRKNNFNKAACPI